MSNNINLLGVFVSVIGGAAVVVVVGGGESPSSLSDASDRLLWLCCSCMPPLCRFARPRGASPAAAVTACSQSRASRPPLPGAAPRPMLADAASQAAPVCVRHVALKLASLGARKVKFVRQPPVCVAATASADANANANANAN